MSVYYGEWSERADVEKEFDAILPTDIEILFASYNYECYEGDAFVLFRQDEVLYEVNGSHCSCFELEEQWTPEKASLKELETRRFTWMEDAARQALRELVGTL